MEASIYIYEFSEQRQAKGGYLFLHVKDENRSYLSKKKKRDEICHGKLKPIVTKLPTK